MNFDSLDVRPELFLLFRGQNPALASRPPQNHGTKMGPTPRRNFPPVPPKQGLLRRFQSLCPLSSYERGPNLYRTSTSTPPLLRRAPRGRSQPFFFSLVCSESGALFFLFGSLFYFIWVMAVIGFFFVSPFSFFFFPTAPALPS